MTELGGGGRPTRGEARFFLVPIALVPRDATFGAVISLESIVAHGRRSALAPDRGWRRLADSRARSGCARPRAMSGDLQSIGGGTPVAHCIRCGAVAAGPCARCHEPVCGDCCVLTEGGSQVWAICFACEDRGGRSLRRAWMRVIGWIAVPIIGLALVVAILAWLSGNHAR